MTPAEWEVRPVEPLAWLNARLAAGEPGCYLRFNDGEAYSMSGLKRDPDTNGEHRYTARVRWGLVKTFGQVCRASAGGEPVLVGSWWYEDPTHPGAQYLRSLVNVTKADSAKIQWSRGHVYHREEGGCPDAELLTFVGHLRRLGYGAVTLYGPAALYEVAYALGVGFVGVADRDAAEGPAPDPRPDRVGVWCAGFPAKGWAWRRWLGSDGQSLVVDAGSLFDGLVGNVSREWLRPGSGPHADFYYGAFREAVLGG